MLPIGSDLHLGLVKTLQIQQQQQQQQQPSFGAAATAMTQSVPNPQLQAETGKS
jgi:hypothetical protein